MRPGRRGGLLVERQTPEREVGFDPHSGHSLVSLSKIHLLPKSTGNTQEAVAQSRHDRKIVYSDVKQKRNKLINETKTNRN